MSEWYVTPDNVDNVIAQALAHVAIGLCKDRFTVKARCAHCSHVTTGSGWKANEFGKGFGLRHGFSCVNPTCKAGDKSAIFLVVSDE